ncbi:hypothetical protein L208DRAFT_1390681 [Tricholoma matsutake]|nr:hypothetical protein L208DRAFT_1390681 [Tricholoma matsutake 945]
MFLSVLVYLLPSLNTAISASSCHTCLVADTGQRSLGQMTKGDLCSSNDHDIGY